MKEIIIGKNETGQRLDKFLAKYMNTAGKSFLYKMIRKKNITLNGKKCTGGEILNNGDLVKLFLSEETILKFSSLEEVPKKSFSPEKGIPAPRVIFENENILVMDKPAGMLSQKADPQDFSANEWILSYLLESGSLSREEMRTFRPSVVNRLDRNTSGLLIAGKTLAALQILSEEIRSRNIRKEYLTLVHGAVNQASRITGYLKKDEGTNTVRISLRPEQENDLKIETEYFPLQATQDITLLKVHLITGRTHQIRAHLSSIGHPVIGDPKYGDSGINRYFHEKYGVNYQLLHAWQITFPDLPVPLSEISGKTLTAEKPDIFCKVLNGLNTGE